MIKCVIGEQIKQDVLIPRKNYLGHFAPKSGRVPDQGALIQAAMASPVGAARLKEMAKSGKFAVIIISDSTRGIPNQTVLPPIIAELKDGGISSDDILIMVATGLHRLATKKELQLVEEEAGGIKAVSHNAFDRAKLVFMGYSRDKTPIWINKEVIESDLVITVGKVEPHEFAGFTGGRKSILPGVAGEDTINWNHRPEYLEHPKCAPGKLLGNPIHEDMEDVAERVGVDFSIQVVLNAEGAVIGAYTGSLAASHGKAVERTSELSSVIIEQRPNIVICHPGSALEINLYQTIKAVISAATIVEDGGIIIVTAACGEGIGPDLLAEPFENATTADEVIAKAKAKYSAEVDHAILLAKIIKRNITVYCVCPGIEDEVSQSMLMQPFKSVQMALDNGLEAIAMSKVMVLDRAPGMIANFNQKQKPLNN